MNQSYLKTKDPKVWGPHYWYMFHNMAYNYVERPSEETKRNLKNFIQSIPFILPCPLCSDHAKIFLERNNHLLDHSVSSRNNLMMFFFFFHNYVNQNTQKKSLSLVDFKKKYD